MRRTTALAGALALALQLSALAGALPLARGPQEPAQTPRDAEAARPAPVDLSGTYRGVFRLDGQSARAEIVIAGESFVLTTDDGVKRTGTIKLVSGGDDPVCELRLDTAPRGASAIRLIARKSLKSLVLTPAPGERVKFSFGPVIHRNRFTGDSASADSNTSSANANASGNTSLNTNSATADGNSEHSKDGNSEHSKDGNSTPRIRTPRDTGHGRSPNVNARATAAENSNGAQNANDAPPDRDDLNAQEARRQLHEGQLALRAPDTMRQGETQTITARLSLDGDDGALTADMPGTGRTSVTRALVSRRMELSLTAEDPKAFDIVAQGNAEQFVVSPFAEWKWSVTPRSSGRHTLRLIGTPKYKFSDGSEELGTPKTIDQPIVIQVSYGYVVTNFLKDKDNLKFLIGGVSLPSLLAAVWKFLQKRRGRKGGGAEPPPDDAPAAD